MGLEMENDEFAEAMSLLLENLWIVREVAPEEYQLIRKHEKALREYFWDKCSWTLVQHQYFYKLEKIPFCPESWMGLTELQEARDYALFCCVMAFLEEKEIEEQFLLSDLCEGLLSLYPGEGDARLYWESYDWRRSLVRVLGAMTERAFLRLVDGDSESFAQEKDGEALYEIAILARYFLRTYPKDLQQYANMAELQAAEFFDEGAALGRGRRSRVYRQLLLTPAYHSAEAQDEDFLYLRNMQRRLRDELESRTGWQFELYKDTAMLTAPERGGAVRQIFPYHQSGIHAVLLHFARFYRAIAERKTTVSPVEFEELLGALRAESGAGWTKEYREMGMRRLAKDVLEELIDWDMAVCDGDTRFITFRPAFFRLVGQYPQEYLEKEVKAGDADQ